MYIDQLIFNLSFVATNLAKKRGNIIKKVTGFNLLLRGARLQPGGVFGEPIKAFPYL
jgi:hypothetical protein